MILSPDNCSVILSPCRDYGDSDIEIKGTEEVVGSKSSQSRKLNGEQAADQRPQDTKVFASANESIESLQYANHHVLVRAGSRALAQKVPRIRAEIQI